MRGKVTLVGAGPGDLGLLTIKGYEFIKSADVVIYDRLVGEDIINIIPESAEKIDVGKESSKHKVPQSNINKLLLEKALDGKNVVRLKGGDCFLFGRGGEELEFLKENSVEFEIVPGITSALAVPAYAGIPATHRDFVSSIHIITGHQKNNEALNINFKNCVECGGTLIFLMGVANIGNIMNGLISNGMKKDMPCGVIENGTKFNQKKFIATVGTIEEICKKENIKSPSIIIVGEVCKFSEHFDWFSKLPLKGKCIVVTRPKDRIDLLSKNLKNLGAEVIEYPCIETISVIEDSLIEDIVIKIKAYDIIVFTSPFGVKSVFEKLYDKKIDGRIFGNKKIAVIGGATGAELEKYGLFADIMPESYDGKSLGSLLGKKAKDKNVLLLRAKNGSDEIIEELKSAGIKFDDTAVYYTKCKNCFDDNIKRKIESGTVDFVTFTSKSTVEAFTSLVKTGYDKFIGVCIGEKTNNEALKYKIRTIISEKADINYMISAIVSEVKKCQ